MALSLWRIDPKETRTQILFWYAGLTGLLLLVVTFIDDIIEGISGLLDRPLIYSLY